MMLVGVYCHTARSILTLPTHGKTMHTWMERKRLLRSEEEKAALMVQRAWALRKAKERPELEVTLAGRKRAKAAIAAATARFWNSKISFMVTARALHNADKAAADGMVDVERRWTETIATVEGRLDQLNAAVKNVHFQESRIRGMKRFLGSKYEAPPPSFS
jgi:hypothetical protein